MDGLVRYFCCFGLVPTVSNQSIVTMVGMVACLTIFLLIVHRTRCQTWFGLRPKSNHPMMSMFTGIYDDTLYLVGGAQDSVTILNLNDIYMTDYNEGLYQPELTVRDAEWTTKRYWYNLNYGLFCNQTCSTQIGHRLYIIAPFKNVSGIITKTSALFIYDMSEYRFLATTGYSSSITRNVEYSCVINNYTHVFIIGGDDYSNKITLYDITTDVWIQMNSTLNIGRNHFGCAFNSNMTHIYVFGGDISSEYGTSTIEQYHIQNDTWSLIYNTNTLSFKRSMHECILDSNTNDIYIFGGGGCSEVNTVCSEYRTLVEIFDTTTLEIRTDTELLLHGASDSYSALYWSYYAPSGSNQSGSWFDAVFVFGGNTEQYDATYIVQYRITRYKIINITDTSWTLDPITYILFIIPTLCLVIICIAFIFKKVKKYTDTRLLSVFFWFLYLMDVIFDCAFNQHLWYREKYPFAVISLFFILFRLVYSVGWQLRLGLKQWQKDIAIRERVNEYLSMHMCGWSIYLYAVLSGSSHGLIHLLNSNLFGLSLFNFGLIDRHIVLYNLTRLPSGLVMGNIPQFMIQIVYILEYYKSQHPMEETKLFYAISTTFISLCFGIRDIWIYNHSRVPVRKLMLDEDFTKPYFLIFSSKEIVEIAPQLIHKGQQIVEAISQMIDVEIDAVEINLCQIVSQGIKVSFIEYSGTKNASDITRELTKSIEDEWFQSAIKTHWKLRDRPSIQLWDIQAMYEHKQMFTADFQLIRVKTHLYQRYGADNCCTKCYKFVCGCTCCHCCGDMLRASSMR